ncbi:MAG: pseudomonalisin [Solirubrobacteraceae bacterium]|nr:pseudomonalisin [Solirubrobacteraceae bacterium]
MRTLSRIALPCLLCLAVLAPATATAAAPTGDRVLVADVLRDLPQATRVGAPAPAQPMRIGIALAHPDPLGEDALLHGLFDRSSPDYHQFLTPTRYAARFGLPASTQRAVRAWLQGAGLTVEHATPVGDYVLASGTVAEVERLTSTTIATYTLGGQTFDANTAPPRVPSRLPIFDVVGLSTKERHQTMAALGGVAAAPNLGNQTPEEVRSVYEHAPGATGQGVSVAILGSGASDSVIADLHTFDAQHGLPALPVDVVHTPASGSFADTSGNVEWNIDMQAIHGMAPGLSREVLYFSPTLADSELTASLGTWVNDPNGPPIMNASLGECEETPIVNPILNNAALDPVNGNDNPDALPVSQAISQASEPTTTMLLQQAVMEGRTFFAASGDNGSSCTVVYPGANGVANEVYPLTSDPASTPFTTAVGGTVLYSDANQPAGRFLEKAWEYSGGNSSPFIQAPDYQQGVANLNRPCVVDRTGQPSNTGKLCRGVPDVAALSGDVISNGYTIVSDGQSASGGGTSLSSPLWAGMWADVVGTAPAGTTGFGFANEAIYAIAKDAARYPLAFFDVTLGANGLNPALPGYDYVTGFGAPRLAGLIDQVHQVAPAVAPAPSSAAAPANAGEMLAARSACAARVARVQRRSLHATRRGVALTGTASDRGCGAAGAGRVGVAIARLAGSRCRFLSAHGRLGAPRSCARPAYLTAHGTARWRLSIRARLPRGSYRALVRAVGAPGKPAVVRFSVR